MGILKKLANMTHQLASKQPTPAGESVTHAAAHTLYDSSFSAALLNKIMDSLSHDKLAVKGSEQAILLKQERRTQQQAMLELNAYSDAELHDLGINRGEIPYVVTHGRIGIDTNYQPDQQRTAA